MTKKKKKTYEVRLNYTAWVSMEVEATNEIEAITIARKTRGELYDEDFSRWQESIMEVIEPWEDQDYVQEVTDEI